MMKTMSCRDLGGACNSEFQANTFEEMAEKSKKHAIEMVKIGDDRHLKAMIKMKHKSEKEMNAWYKKKKSKFRTLPEDE